MFIKTRRKNPGRFRLTRKTAKKNAAYTAISTQEANAFVHIKKSP
jgi:hypothetical protein